MILPILNAAVLAAIARWRTTMTDGDLLQYMGIDGSRWAAEFCKIARDKGHDLDEGWMLGWFANAIMAGYDRGRGISVSRLPDGSGFIVE